MNYKGRRLFTIVMILLGLFGVHRAHADSADDAAQANNPLANLTAFNIQGYYIGELTESDFDANQFWLRFAKPFSIADTTWLLRASLPFNSFPESY